MKELDKKQKKDLIFISRTLLKWVQKNITDKGMICDLKTQKYIYPNVD